MKLIACLGAVALVVPLAFVAASSSNVGPTLPKPASWDIDPVHTSVVFKVRHMNTSNFYGRFNKTTGTVVMNEEKPAESKVELLIAVDSIDSNNDGRNTHLKSPDFFNAKEFPQIEFISHTVKKVDKHWKVDGDLTMHGETKSMSLDVEVTGSGDMRGTKIIGFESTFKLKRSDFGMSGMLDALGDEITVMAGFECTAAK